MGDPRKSWDVLATVRFIEEHLPNDAPIVDFGAYQSEITGILSRLGYANLCGVDLNPRLPQGPYPDRIRYVVADYLNSGLPDASFDAITTISAIEHGHSTERLLAEVSRLLRPGGYLVGSTDYWPEKVDTRGVSIFGMDWTIFSSGEMASFFEASQAHGLTPVGSLEYQGGVPAIVFRKRRYTFAWFALQKRSS